MDIDKDKIKIYKFESGHFVKYHAKDLKELEKMLVQYNRKEEQEEKPINSNSQKNNFGKKFLNTHRKRKLFYSKAFNDLMSLIGEFHKLECKYKYLFKQSIKERNAITKYKKQLREDSEFKHILHNLNKDMYDKVVNIKMIEQEKNGHR